MICKSTLDKLGKAAFNSLSSDDKTKYLAASNVVDIINKGIEAQIMPSSTDFITVLSTVGVEAGTKAVILLASEVTGYNAETLTEAISALVEYVGKTITALINQIKHEIAAKLAVLFGVSENPGILGCILEWVYLTFIKNKL